ncbi:MAG: phospho-N-acetylmuramoyl-pentapeptide-transferase [Firmicutes bacterium]|nr:phospho-N-acetylmuramoyl-pentapeptide-transferase [Bacillota bacterium]
MYTLETGIYSLFIAFVINIILCPIIIPFLHRLKFGQPIREEGPQSHQKKSGTPTMGGVMILLAMFVSAAFFLKGNTDAAAVAAITMLYGLIGFIDDYIKVVKKHNLGLRAWQKIVFQILVTAGFAWYILKYAQLGTQVYVPFMKGFQLDLGILYVPFLFFVMVGTVNAVNLTDGLDGLASGVTLLVAVFFLFAALMSGSGLVPVCGAAAGALLGFLLFNSNPARVFMGDTGSLALGGFVASTAVLLKLPLMILIVGGVYLCEALSVILQVGYFKISGGKRIFKMAPIHHHFEMCGMSETKVVTLFYIVTALLCLVGYLGLKGVFGA